MSVFRSLRELNESIPERISDHSPIIVDVPPQEPSLTTSLLRHRGEKDDKPRVLSLLAQQVRRHPLLGDSSVNLFVRDSLRQSGARFCHLHSQRPPIRA